MGELPETDLDFGRLVDEEEEHDEDGVAVGVAVHHAAPAADCHGLWRFLEMWSTAATLAPRYSAAAALARCPLRPQPTPLRCRARPPLLCPSPRSTTAAPLPRSPTVASPATRRPLPRSPITAPPVAGLPH
uniref:Uncharacterized protein n=1 Tax=Oryza sativa subsp. japonica TaxID=39947 RepID=Q6Z6T0_ORYSJ|nr:hypothetical protein [Oryza sativa Japonica Group]BAD15965.1 hypothetical protein [Oryza sativa Japonica Group]